MDRFTASKLTRETLDKYNLTDWSVRLTTDINAPFLGMCMYRDKCIILNAHHIDIHPDAEIVDTILHEVAHALCPGCSHNEIWAAKAREIGCTNTLPCSHLSLPANIIDAIRSGQMVEMTVEEETHVIRRPKYTVTRLQDKCPECGKVAVEKFAIDTVDKQGNNVKLITLECFHIIKKIVPKGTPFEEMISNYWKDEVKNCKHEWNKNQCNKCGEYTLYKFQQVGGQFVETALAQQKGVGVFDDMGLGKTVQGLSPLRFHPDLYTPCIVVTKSATKFQWFKQAVRWLGLQFISQIISTSKDAILPGLKLYIIPYDLLRRFPLQKLSGKFKLVILDECQQIKNPDSSRTQAVRKLIAANPECKVIGLSGTPWKNRGGEFFPILNMIDPIKFHSHQHYLDNWVDYYYEGPKRKMGGIRNIKRFKEYTQSLLIRREYEEVMDEFPTTNRMKLSVKLDDLQQSAYDNSVSDFVEWYNQFVIGGEEDKVSSIEILAQLARMRHITGLAKIPATLGFIEEFIEETEKKIVVFVHHQDVGKIMVSSLTDTNKTTNPDYYELAQSLKDENIPVFAYTSAHTGKPEGYDIQEKFNKTQRCIMIASTLACGEGLDLQTCSNCIMHERQWNPQNEDQAAPGRFRRIGQLDNQINITFPEAEETVDEHLDGINDRKRRQYHAVMNKGEVPAWSQDAMAKELAEIIIAKHKAKKAKSGNVKQTNITTIATLR